MRKKKPTAEQVLDGLYRADLRVMESSDIKAFNNSDKGLVLMLYSKDFDFGCMDELVGYMRSISKKRSDFKLSKSKVREGE